MIAIAILAADRALCRSLELLLHDEPDIALAATAGDPLLLADPLREHRIDVILVNAPLMEQFADWQSSHGQIPWAVILDGSDETLASVALRRGASAVLSRSVDRAELLGTIKAVSHGLIVFQRQVADTLLNADLPGNEKAYLRTERQTSLTPRELEVLTAMADGASNKAIARRLGISFHTVKFHVASILEKLDADSRTEAVMKAAQLGMVML
jgi:DNA-binding NarL/FixJ family response regulator